MKKQTINQAKSKEKYFVLWAADENIFEAAEYDTLQGAERAAELFLKENDNPDLEYYVAKAVQKCYYKTIIEDL